MTGNNTLEKTDRALDILIRLEAMLGATLYLMQGEEHRLGQPYDDFEIWLNDIRDRVGMVKDLVEE